MNVRSRAGPVLAVTIFVGAICFGAACGGSSGPVTAPDTPAQRAADAAAARRAVLRSGDVPQGFGSRRHRDDAPELTDAEQQRLAACTKVPAIFLDADSDDPRADSPDFTYGRYGHRPAQVLASSVAIARSSEDLRTAIARLATDAGARCFEPWFRAGFAQGRSSESAATMREFAVRRRDIGRIGDQSAAFHATATFETPGGTAHPDLNLYFVRRGRALVTMYAAGNNEPFDAHLAESLLSTIASRLGSMA